MFEFPPCVLFNYNIRKGDLVRVQEVGIDCASTVKITDLHYKSLCECKLYIRRDNDLHERYFYPYTEIHEWFLSRDVFVDSISERSATFNTIADLHKAFPAIRDMPVKRRSMQSHH